MRRIAALIAVSVAVGAALPAAPATAASPEGVMFEKVNQIRHAHGLARMHPSLSLFYSARRYARRMMRSDYFGHQAKIPVAGRYRTAGETLVKNFAICGREKTKRHTRLISPARPLVRCRLYQKN